MFGLFRKKNPIDQLQKKYNRLMEESYKLSTTNRQASDEKRSEAEEVLAEIEKIKSAK